MKTQIFSFALVALFAAGIFAGTADIAAARGFHRSVSAQGANGHGYTKNVNRNCSGGTCNGQRSVQTNQGYGWTSDHNRSCADGSCSGSTTVTGNNGKTWTRNSGATANGDGTGSWYSNTSGPNGGSKSSSGTWSRSNPQD
jgi:hypothetical protein